MAWMAAQNSGWTRAPFGAARLRVGLLVLLVGAATPGAALGQERYELSGGQWQKQPAPEPGTPEGQIQTIRRHLAAGRADEARELAGAWIEQHPNHPLLVESYLLRGDARVAIRHYYNALFDYEYVIRYFPASEQFHTALEREYEIARLFINGMNRRFLGMRLLPADGEGEELLIRIQERAPGSELGERASLTLADYYYESGDMLSAADAYDLFLENYPASVQREWAMLRLIQSSLARFKGPRFDPTGLIDAAQRLRMYREEFPAAADRVGADALLVRIDESLAQGRYLTARWYERRSEPVSAAYLYRRVIEDYPQTAAAEQALAALETMPTAVLRGLPAGPGGGDASRPTTAPADDDMPDDSELDTGPMTP